MKTVNQLWGEYKIQAGLMKASAAELSARKNTFCAGMAAALGVLNDAAASGEESGPDILTDLHNQLMAEVEKVH